MEGAWARIERWLAESAPDVLDSLQPGATDEQISNTEAALGLTLPQDVRASYRIHDGQSPDGPGFMDAWEFLSLSRMVDEWRIWKGLLDGGDLAGAKSEPEEGVADDWWNPKWVPPDLQRLRRPPLPGPCPHAGRRSRPDHPHVSRRPDAAGRRTELRGVARGSRRRPRSRPLRLL
jgi:hypothetical protein